MNRILSRRFFLFSSYNHINPYKVLGITQTNTQEQIRTAYYKLAKMYHPDVKAQYAQKFKEINEAYSILKDPAKKQQYDLSVKSSSAQSDQQYFKRHYQPYMKQNNSRGYQNFSYDRRNYYNRYGPMNPQYQNHNTYDYQQAYRKAYEQKMRQAYLRQMQRQTVRRFRYSKSNIQVYIVLIITGIFTGQMMYKLYQMQKRKKQIISGQYFMDPSNHSFRQ